MEGKYLLILTLAFIALIIAGIIFTGSQIEQIPFITNNDNEKSQTNGKTGDNSEGGDISGSTGGGAFGGGGGIGGSSGGGGGGTGSGGSGTPLVCHTEIITYSLLNVYKNEICNIQQGGICEDKTVICTIEIHNEETDGTGAFTIELYYTERGKNISQALNVAVKNFNVAPLQFQLFQDSSNFQSTGINGTSNQEINCIFQTAKVPTKEVCV